MGVTRVQHVPVTTALIARIIALGGVVLNQVAGPMVKAEQEHRQYLRVRAEWQCQILDPYPLRTRRCRRIAVLTVASIVVVWAAVLLVAMLG